MCLAQFTPHPIRAMPGSIGAYGEVDVYEISPIMVVETCVGITRRLRGSRW